MAEAAKTYGEIHILFNNAGGGGGGKFPTETTEEWNRVVNVNLNGTFYVSRAVWPHLVAGGGVVVNMSSLAAQRGFSPRMYDEFGTASSSYYAAKAGIDALTRYMAGVGGKHNIRVNCVRPGQIMTPGATRGTINDPTAGITCSRRCSISPRSSRVRAIQTTSRTLFCFWYPTSLVSSRPRSSTSTAESPRRSDARYRRC